MRSSERLGRDQLRCDQNAWVKLSSSRDVHVDDPLGYIWGLPSIISKVAGSDDGWDSRTAVGALDVNLGVGATKIDGADVATAGCPGTAGAGA